MLHRLPSSAVIPHVQPARQLDGGRRRPVSPRVRQWLQAPGSLTARLRAHGRVEVRVIHQGRQTLWPQERLAIGATQGHVREVVLSIDGRPAVWARSVTSQTGLKGPWRALKGLGTRPLAELLFEHPQVRRDPLWGTRLPLTSPEQAHVARQWADLGQDLPVIGPAPCWVRRSVFWHKGHALQVMESFAPWVLMLSANVR